ncbi:type II toxin-antitoxin system RelE family toxin [Methanocaldococcus infernus]|uniref:type II toxin-antitoxin system RelE family toxin n=1 Tax=Methanocaldococcus infernus TaxID=67760 RepID=UPI00373AF3F6
MHKSAKKSLKDLPKSIKTKIIEFLIQLKSNPFPTSDIRKLRNLNNTFRAKFGDYRVVYSIDFDKRLIRVIKIEHRKKVYKRL